MTTLPTDLKPGDLITVTFSLDGQDYTWHGGFQSVNEVFTLDRGEEFGDRRYEHTPINSLIPGRHPWISLYPASAYRFDFQGLPARGPQSLISPAFNIQVDLTMPTLVVTRVTDEGQAFITKRESADTKRYRLLALFRETNPEAANELDQVIDELTREAANEAALREYELHQH